MYSFIDRLPMAALMLDGRAEWWQQRPYGSQNQKYLLSGSL